ncbi:LLM class flavin-dependent oxidoreductase [Rhizorhabdus argentea]|uniref:LLM class flavin-dependent oxidoreductase n=1 Tax=Rhizorhabdus argentea TaxID=1387174 RepID=UPI0030EDC4A3
MSCNGPDFGIATAYTVPESFKGMYDPLLSHTAVAAVTKRLKLGSSISIITEHHPISLATRIRDARSFSGGRFILGAGWSAGLLLLLPTAHRARQRPSRGAGFIWRLLKGISGFWLQMQRGSTGPWCSSILNRSKPFMLMCP